MKERMLLIDGWNVMISQNSVQNIIDFNGEPIGMYLGTINQIKSFVEKFKPHKIIFVLDGPNAGERRRKLYKNYKGKRKIINRSSTVKLHIGDEKDEIDEYATDDGFQNQLVKIYEFLKLLPVTVVIVPFCEADDIICYLAKKNREKFDATIVSTDKDYLQMIDVDISVYNWHTKVIFNIEEFEKKFQIKPINYIFQKIILGDTSDKIGNIKSIGKATFARLFQSMFLEHEYKELQDLLKVIDEYDITSLEKKYLKFIELLKQKESRDSLVLNYQLIKLDESYLMTHHINLLKKQVDEQNKKVLSKMSARLKLYKDSFNKLYGTYESSFNADKFLQTFVFVSSKEELTV
jgi:5'-3' exonuclease